MKKIGVILCILLFSITLVSCGKDDSKKDVENFFKAYKSLDFKEASKYAENGGNLSQVINIFESYDGKKESALKYWISKVSYKIQDVKTKGDIQEVKVTINALDGNVIYENYKDGVSELSPTKINNNIDVPSNEENGNIDYVEANYGNINYIDEFIAALENQEVPLKETTVTIKMKKIDGNYKIENDDEVLTAILGGFPVQVLLD